MVMLSVVTRAGNEIEVEGRVGGTVMEAIRDAGIDEMMALCGGCCSCCTCHVYVDEAFAGSLMPLTAAEDDLLEMSAQRMPLSRLSCQLPVTDKLEGLRVTLAPED